MNIPIAHVSLQTVRTWEILTQPDNLKIRWFGKSDRRGNLGGTVRAPDAFENLTRLSDQGYNLYVTLNPTNERPAKRINTTDVTQWAFILIDCDPLQDWGEASAAHFAQIMWERLARLNMHPATIYTGRGIQFWVRLWPRVLETKATRDYCVGVNRGFLQYVRTELLKDLTGWKVDMLSDLARIARMPGAMHQKTGRKARLIYSGRPMTEESTQACAARFYVAPPILPQPFNGATDRDWTEVRDELTARAKNFLTMGVDAGSRHEDVQHCCKTLFERGVGKASAFEAICYGNEACKVPLSERELLVILEQVYRGR